MKMHIATDNDDIFSIHLKEPWKDENLWRSDRMLFCINLDSRNGRYLRDIAPPPGEKREVELRPVDGPEPKPLQPRPEPGLLEVAMHMEAHRMGAGFQADPDGSAGKAAALIAAVREQEGKDAE